jgi:membrane-associated PAP2 superfamily phosphatase
VYNVDASVTQLWYDPISGKFPVRDSYFLEQVLHHWAKNAVLVLGMAALITYILSFFIKAIRPFRKILLFVVLAMTLPATTVRYLKTVSNQTCPWSLQEYGGSTPHQAELFSAPSPNAKKAHCWPAGHATAGFALMAFYFPFYKLKRRRLAHAALWGGLLFGNLLGFGRVMQGAHFLSHQIWSVLVCWLVMLLLYEWMLRRDSVSAEKEASPATFSAEQEEGSY